MAFLPCSLPDTLHIPALSPLLLELPRVFPMLCLVSLLLHSVPCSQLTNQHKPSCRCMQSLPPSVLSLALGRSELCSLAGMDAGSPGWHSLA